jgi:thiamine pyrophosphokinase
MTDRPGARQRHVLVVADGDVATRAELDASWPGWSDGLMTVVAADGGYARAAFLGFSPDVLVGDLDSLPADQVAAAESAGAAVLRFAPDKDESDTELAILEAARRGATRITVVGGFGGPRLDHALANLWLLSHPQLVGIDLTLLDAGARARLMTAPGPQGAPVTMALPGRLGAMVSLLPFGGDAEGVSTHGLRYPLHDEPLRLGPARGLSNVRVAERPVVTLRAGRLLVVERPA